MKQAWIKSEIGQRVLGYALDPRPVWFWNEDGSKLIWRNMAAKLFRSKFKKKGIKFLPDPVPLKGQVSRLIKLGANGSASISRMRFRLGKKPVSSTCSCIPLQDTKGKKALLVISTDSVDLEQFNGDAFELVADEQLFNPPQDYVILNGEGDVVAAAVASGEPELLEYVLTHNSDQFKDATRLSVRLEAGAALNMLELVKLVSVPDEEDETEAAFDGENEFILLSEEEGEGDETLGEQEGVSFDMFAAQQVESARQTKKSKKKQQRTPKASETVEKDDKTDLLGLVDQLYAAPVDLEDETFSDTTILHENRILPEDAEASDEETLAEIAIIDDEESSSSEALSEDQLAEQAPLELKKVADQLSRIEKAQTVEQEQATSAPADEPKLWQITATHKLQEVSDADAAAIAAGFDAEQDDKTSRYNFDELSRILNERVNVGEGAEKETEDTPTTAETEARESNSETSKSEKTQNSNALVALSDEALVLNKLPLGILIFKDQDILFANRSMADLAGYDTSNELRDAGLDAILPRAENGGEGFGAITKLTRQDGSNIEVNARLQTAKWYGNSAYMLTARAAEQSAAPNGILAADIDDTRAEMEKIAGLFNYGLIQLNRAGYVLDLDDEGARLFGPSIDLLRNRPILEYVSADTRGTYLKLLSGEISEGEIKVFAGAQHCDLRLVCFEQADASASIYGFLSTQHQKLAQIDPQRDELNAILPILSREVRRPLATIAGFNSLMRDEAYGLIENDRYKEYVSDIHHATKQIEQVIGEIDDLSRLNVGEIEISSEKIDLGLLLNQCIGRIRAQANAQRVFVRSAIPETSYMVEADEKLLIQTIMNLLASAVTLTPEGGNVVLSAVDDEENGDLMIHVRDTGDSEDNRYEQFIVYHEPEPNQELKKGNLVRSGVGLSLTHALAKANAFELKLDQAGRAGMLMELAIPAARISIAQN